MKENLVIRDLDKNDVPQMHQAFNAAFAGYALKFEMDRDQFVKKFVEKLNINWSFSAGAFDSDQLVGFIFTNISPYKGKLSAYNGGAGVIPAYRKQHLTGELYRFLIPLFRHRGVRQCILEVLTTNKKAIHAYEKVGFRKVRLYRCFKLMDKLSVPSIKNVTVKVTQQPDWKGYDGFADFGPSFLDSQQVLKTNIKNERVIEAFFGEILAGYAIYQPGPGRISQLAVRKSSRGKGVGSALLNYIYRDADTKAITIINIPDTACEAIKFFENRGFVNQVNQYEMAMKI